MQFTLILTRILDINECDSKPCDSSGKCVDTDGSYVCTCEEGLVKNGNKCEGELLLRIIVAGILLQQNKLSLLQIES